MPPALAAVMRRRLPSWAAALLLAAVVFAAYAPALRGGWLWDDGDYVTRNPALTAPDGLTRIWSVGATPQYYPVTFTTFWLERRLWGLNTEGYHVVNAALHAANAFLVLLILDGLGFAWAWLAALLFAVHPIEAESVAWISERKNVLSGLFYLLSLRWRLRADAGLDRRGGPKSLAAFAAALLSKSTACTLPAVLLLLRWRERGRLERKDWKVAAPYFVMAAVMACVTVWVELLGVGSNGPDFELTALQRLLVSARSLWFYVGKLAWPVGLAFSYPRWTIDPASARQWLPLAGCAAAAAAGWAWGRKTPAARGVAAAALFFAGTLFPALGFFKIYPQRYSYVADHFQYMAGVGLLALAAAAVHRLSAGRRWPGLALAGVLAALTWRQAHAYSSLRALWQDTLEKNPDSYLALGNLGEILHQEGRLPEAVALYGRALALKPDLIEIQNDLGNALAQSGRVEEAVGWYKRALLFQPAYAEAHNNLGLALLRLGKPREAAACFEKAAALKPQLTGARYNLGLARAALGDWSGASELFARVVAERPDYAPARVRLDEARARTRR